ncbi:MAG: hypothetical protein CMI55_01675 [Parcubacteria group bacterium]|jgi:O-antigen ligase|nr:hypothetical protein [Parcubacteria group bacterium]|tara:strand:- start:7420 stop:8769 length:1350 start_codon:yes stop_codon:yes gene_type:complete
MLIYLEKFLFYLLIFCLPWQTRKIAHIWGSDFNEWTSAYLYLTDLLVIAILGFWLRRQRKKRFLKKGLRIKIQNPGFWLGVFLIISLISLIQASNLSLGFYQALKLCQMIGLFFYLKSTHLINFKRVAQFFVASGLIQALIALVQFLNQQSLGLRLLGESPLAIGISGVAKIMVGPLKMIRAYGTLPHPNVLAAFLLVSIFFLYFLWLSKKHSFLNNLFLLIVYWFLLTGLLLTFARTIIAIFLLASLIYFIFIVWKVIQVFNGPLLKRTIAVFLLFVVFSVSLGLLAWPELSDRFQVSLTEQSVGLRVFYGQIALAMIHDHPWLGIGLGNLVWEMRQALDLLAAWIHQPVHNIYLLIASEIGLIGLAVFLMFVYQLLRQYREQRTENKEQKTVLLFLVSCLLIIGLFDHFFWTLQQGQIMFWLILGLIAQMKSRPILNRDRPVVDEVV